MHGSLNTLQHTLLLLNNCFKVPDTFVSNFYGHTCKVIFNKHIIGYWQTVKCSYVMKFNIIVYINIQNDYLLFEYYKLQEIQTETSKYLFVQHVLLRNNQLVFVKTLQTYFPNIAHPYCAHP